jgi:hypothetical protein
MLTNKLDGLDWVLQGKHPEWKAPILISIGHYGPFLRCKAVFVSIPKARSINYGAILENL